MRNREENDLSSSDNIKTIKQRYYKAIDKFGEIHKLKLIIPEDYTQKSENFDLEFDVNGNLSMKCVYFPFIDEQKPLNTNIEFNTPVVTCNYCYIDKKIKEIRVFSSDLFSKERNHRYLRYFDLSDYFSIPGDEYTLLKDTLIDINKSPMVKFEYSSAGLKNKELNFNIEGLIVETTEFHYTDDDKIKDVTTIAEDRTVIRKIIYKYAENGLLTEIKDYGVEGMIRNRTEFIYHDESSVPKIITIFDKEGKINDQYKFGEDGKLSLHEKNEKNWNGSTHKTTYTYDYHSNGEYNVCENGTFINRKYYDAEKNLILCKGPNSSSEYSYNNYGLLIENSPSSNHFDKIIYKYKYDAFNNWIECVSYRNELPLEIKTREITYF